MGYYTELASQAHNTSYGDTMEVMWVMGKVPDIAKKGTQACRRMSVLVANMSVHEETMWRHAANGFSTASELAAVMLRERNTPWRVAHAIVAGVVRRLIQAGKTAVDMTPEIIDEVAVEITGSPMQLTEDAIQGACDPLKFVEAMTSQGGTAPDETERMIKARQAELALARNRQSERVHRLEEADRKLSAVVSTALRSTDASLPKKADHLPGTPF